MTKKTKKALLEELEELGLSDMVSATIPRDDLEELITEQRNKLNLAKRQKEKEKEMPTEKPKDKKVIKPEVTTVLNTYEDKVKKHISINIVPFTNLSITYNEITDELLNEVQGDIIQWKQLLKDLNVSKDIPVETAPPQASKPKTDTKVSTKTEKPVEALKTNQRDDLVGVVNWQEVPDNITVPENGCKQCEGNNFTYKTGITKSGQNQGKAWHNMACQDCKDGNWPTGNWVYPSEADVNPKTLEPKVIKSSHKNEIEEEHIPF